MFAGRHLVRLAEIMRHVCADFETEPTEYNGEANHAHLPVNFPPKATLSKLASPRKGLSARRMRQEYPDLRHHHRRANPLWSGSYFTGPAGGAPLTVLRQYTEQQNRPV